MSRNLALAVASALLSACGSAGEEPLTQSQFAGQAGVACRDAGRKLERLRSPRSLAQFERHVNRSGFIVQRLADRLGALNPPERRADVYEKFLKLVDGNLKAIHAVQRAVLNGRLTRLAGIENSGLSTNVLERRYTRTLGIEPCAGVTSVETPEPPAAPRRPSQAADPAPDPASPGPAPRVPLGAGGRAEFIAGCSLRAGRPVCKCLYDQLTKRYGYDTEAKLLQLLRDTRPALRSGDPADIPAPLRKAAIACADGVV